MTECSTCWRWGERSRRWPPGRTRPIPGSPASPSATRCSTTTSISPTSCQRGSTSPLSSCSIASIHSSTRRLGFARLPAALAGLAASLLATNGLYGFDVGSYVWRGYGMYTQLWGMVLLPPTVAQGYVTLREGRGFFWTLLLLAATLMSHLVSGYIAGVSLVVVALLCGPRGALWRRGARLALLGALLALVLAYFLVPYLLDSTYMNRSVW